MSGAGLRELLLSDDPVNVRYGIELAQQITDPEHLRSLLGALVRDDRGGWTLLWSEKLLPRTVLIAMLGRTWGLPGTERFGPDDYNILYEYAGLLSPALCATLRLRITLPTLVSVPAGRFSMGATGQERHWEWDESIGSSDERPHHEVQICQDFAMGETLVDQSLWQAVMGRNPCHHRVGDHAIDRVTWLDAIRFCNRLSAVAGLTPVYTFTNFRVGFLHLRGHFQNAVLWDVCWDRDRRGYRLPTEAEWEYAARAGTDTIFPGADDPEEVGWSVWNCDSIQPTRMLRPNARGLYDLHGSVWEWCWDEKRPYTDAAEIDPTSGLLMSTGSRRVLRGGSWRSEPERGTVTARKGLSAEIRVRLHLECCGLRVVLDEAIAG